MSSPRVKEEIRRAAANASLAKVATPASSCNVAHRTNGLRHSTLRGRGVARGHDVLPHLVAVEISSLWSGDDRGLRTSGHLADVARGVGVSSFGRHVDRTRLRPEKSRKTRTDGEDGPDAHFADRVGLGSTGAGPIPSTPERLRCPGSPHPAGYVGMGLGVFPPLGNTIRSSVRADWRH